MYSGTTTTRSTTERQPTTAGVEPSPVFNQRNSQPLQRAAQPSRCACWALRFFYGLCWLTALAVAAFVTPGEDWLRRSDGSKISGFRVGGGDGEFFSGCDSGPLRSSWCSHCKGFCMGG